MITKEILQTIENVTKELARKLGIEGVINVSSKEDDSVTADISLQDPQLFIGEKGQTLSEIQYILKLLLKKKIEEPFYFVLDINEYRKSKEHYIREIAKDAADEVELLKKEKELNPMSAAERRVVHMVVSEREGLVSESIGEGAGRRVTIRLKSAAAE